MDFELDYSEVKPFNQSLPAQEEWEPPIHKFFGKKLPNGKTEKEPVYVHQEYPRLMYSLRDKKIVAKLVHSDAELMELGEGWEKTFAAFGHVSAPSYEQHLEIEARKQAALQEQVNTAHEVVTAFAESVQTAKRGRPAKV